MNESNSSCSYFQKNVINIIYCSYETLESIQFTLLAFFYYMSNLFSFKLLTKDFINKSQHAMKPYLGFGENSFYLFTSHLNLTLTERNKSTSSSL